MTRFQRSFFVLISFAAYLMFRLVLVAVPIALIGWIVLHFLVKYW